MEGIKNPAWLDMLGRVGGSFNSAHIFILNDRYPRAGMAGKGIGIEGRKFPAARDITVLRSSTF